jgi:hypothetical protein
MEMTPGSINYADMPIGKKSVLAPVSMGGNQILDSQSQVI